MSILSAINTAQAIFSNTGTQTSIVSKNIANASNPHYARRDALLTTAVGGASVVKISRAEDLVLFRQNLMGVADSSGQSALLSGLQQLRNFLGGNEYESAPSKLLTDFRDRLQAFVSKPNDQTIATALLNDARDLNEGLNRLSTATQQLRKTSDEKIGNAVEDLNDLLQRFQTANTDVVNGTQLGRDVSDSLDERDKILGEISSIVGITTIRRGDNDLALYTTDGATLFETVPREVSFTETATFTAGVTGSTVYIDGVPVSSGVGPDTSAKGSLQSLLQLRDDIAPTYQNQLDEMARGLITAFAESDLVAAGPDLPGLFTWPTGTVPPAGTVVPGLASQITINPLVDPAQGGDINRIRDGGINGVNYVANGTGAASFATHLEGFITALETPLTYDVAADNGNNVTLMEFSADSTGWLESLRSDASKAAETKEAYQLRIKEAHSNQTGVSMDEELSRLIQLEQSYKASARILTTVDEMLQRLLSI